MRICRNVHGLCMNVYGVCMKISAKKTCVRGKRDLLVRSAKGTNPPPNDHMPTHTYNSTYPPICSPICLLTYLHTCLCMKVSARRGTKPPPENDHMRRYPNMLTCRIPCVYGHARAYVHEPVYIARAHQLRCNL